MGIRSRGATPLRRRQKRGEVGQALAELAIMLPLMLVLVIGVIEVNSGMNAYITVVNSARDGARLGSKGGASTGEIETLVIKDLDRLPETTPSTNVTVTFPTISGQPAVKVQSCYDHRTLLQVPILMPGTFRMCSQTTMPKLN